MSNHQIKLHVLEVLRQQHAYISLPEILNLLGDGYSERTVRRWLSEWIHEGLIIKTGLRRATRYIASKSDETTAVKLSYFSDASQKVLELIRKPYSLRKPVTYNSDWLQNYRPNVDSYIELSLEERLLDVGKRAQTHEPAGTYARQIYQRLLIDLSYNSSRLEGNTYSLLETKKLIIEGIDTPGKLDEEKIMILNHKEAIRYLVDSPGEIQVKKSTICTLHNLLSDGLVSPQYAGQVRDYGVRISGTGYVPLENPQYLEIFLNEICQKAALIKKPFEQSIFLLAHIAYLQAFVDVNKRTSRLSANIPLINHNLVPLSFNDVTQEDYTSAMLAVYEMNDIRPLIDVYVHSYLRTSTAYDATIGAINFDPVRVRYRQQRRQIIRHIVSNVYDAKKTKSYIASVVPELVKQEDIMQVLKNIEDDLAQLGPQSMAGLGISSAQLMLWRDKNKK